MSGESPLGVRQRVGGGPAAKQSKSPALGPTTAASVSTDDEVHSKIAKQKGAGAGPFKKPSQKGYKIALILVTIVSFITRFWKINHPDQVVFDEVHFGKVCESPQWEKEKNDKYTLILIRL